MGEDGKRLYFTNRQRRSQLNFDPKDIDPLDWWKGSWSYRIVSWIIERGWESDNLRNYSRLLFSIPCNCRMRTALLLLFTINIPSSVFHRVVHSIFLETGLDITRYLKCIYVYQTQKAFKGTVKGTTFETAPALAQPRMLTVISTEPLGCQRQVLLPPFDFETSEASRHDLTIMRWWRLFPFCWIEVKSQRWMEISEQLESSVGIDIAALSGRLERWLSLYWMFFFFFPAFSSLVWLHVFWICDSFSLLNNSVTPLATSTTVGISTSWDTHYPGMKVTLTRRFAEGIWYDSIADSFEVEWPWMTLQFVLGAHAVQLVTGVVCESWWWLYRPIEFI